MPSSVSRKRIADSLETFVEKVYEPALRFAAHHRYTTLASVPGGRHGIHRIFHVREDGFCEHAIYRQEPHRRHDPHAERHQDRRY